MRCAPLRVHLHQTSRVGVNPPRDGRGNAPLRAPDARAGGKPMEKAVDPVWVCGGKSVDRLWKACADVARPRRKSRASPLRSCGLDVDNLWTRQVVARGAPPSNIRRTSAGSALTPRATISLMRAFGPGS